PSPGTTDGMSRTRSLVATLAILAFLGAALASQALPARGTKANGPTAKAPSHRPTAAAAARPPISFIAQRTPACTAVWSVLSPADNQPNGALMGADAVGPNNLWTVGLSQP